MLTFPTVPRLVQSLSLAVAFGLGTFGCQPTVDQGQQAGDEAGVVREVMDITVSIPPQQYFLEKIGGDLVQVSVLVPGNSDPHTYEPKPQQLMALSEAEAYVLVGFGFEQPWLEKLKAANADMVLIDSAQGITPMEMEEHDHGHDHGHSHSHDHNHDHSAEEHQEAGAVTIADPHIWLSPSLVKQQATTIAEGLSKLDPDNREQYEANLAKFLEEIGQLDQELRQILEPLPQRKFIVFHPSWAYFARDYNLVQIPVEVDGQEPSARELKALIDTAKENNLTVVFAETQFSTKSSEAIAAEINGQVELLDPLSPDWSNNLITVAQKIANANSAQP